MVITSQVAKRVESSVVVCEIMRTVLKEKSMYLSKYYVCNLLNFLSWFSNK